MKEVVLTIEEKTQIIQEIAFRITENESLCNILNKANQKRLGYPSQYLFFKWIGENSALADIYRASRAIQAHHRFDMMYNIAERLGDSTDDNMTKINRDRLRIDTLKFQVSKLLPSVYGDKVDMTSNGETVNVISLGAGVKPPTEAVDISFEEVKDVDIMKK